MSDPFGYGYAVSHIGDPLFCYGYAVSHSEPSALIPLIGYIFFIYVMVIDMGMVMAWALGDCDSIWLYNISLTHIRP